MRRSIILMPVIILAVISLSLLAMPPEITKDMAVKAGKYMNLLAVISLAILLIAVIFHIISNRNSKNAKKGRAHHYK